MRPRLMVVLTVLPLLATGSVVAWGDSDAEFAERRRKMVRVIEDDAMFTQPYVGKATLDGKVLQVMGEVPRHRFVPEEQIPYAYANRPLPIGYGQTISQPFIVALMTDLLNVDAGAKVLEVGTGSGYQAAVLSKLVDRVYSIEIIEELGTRARRRLQELGYDNITVRIGDGYFGWEEHAPFDGIIVTAAAGHVPPPLVKQLKPGGVMIIPVGPPFRTQQLVRVTKEKDGGVRSEHLLPVAFVPLTGDH